MTPHPHLNPETTLILINPRSSAGRTAKRKHTILRTLRNAFGLHHLRETNAPQHATAIARTAAQEGFKSIVSIGGDGTHSEIVDGLLQASAYTSSPVCLVPIPSGTGSDLCRLLQGGHSWESRVEALRTAQPQRIDAGLCSFLPKTPRGPTQRAFLNAATCGFNGLVDEYVNTSTSTAPTYAFLNAMVRAWLRYTPPLCDIILDGVSIGTHRILTASASNGRFVGAGMMIAPRARLCDGLLDVLIVPSAPLSTLLRVLPAVYRGNIHTHPHTITARASSIEIIPLEDHRAFIDLDGEHPGYTPLSWHVLPNALCVLGVRGPFV